MKLKPTVGITAGLTILCNTSTGAIYVATKATEETQCEGEARNHIKPIGDMTIKTLDTADVIRKLCRGILHGDDEHKEWLIQECENFIERECL